MRRKNDTKAVLVRLVDLLVRFLLVFVTVSCCLVSNHGAFAAASGMIELMDASTGKLQSIPGQVQATDITTVITSPGTPSTVLSSDDDLLSSSSGGSNVLLAARPGDGGSALLVCRGATLAAAAADPGADADDDGNAGRCLTACGCVSDCLVVDGVTAGDVLAAGLRRSRHARTLSALFRSRMLLAHKDGDDDDRTTKQTLILAVSGGSVDETARSAAEQDVEAIFKAIAVEKKGIASFSDLYDLRVVSADDSSPVLPMATQAAKSAAGGRAAQPLAATLQTALRLVNSNKEVSSPSALDPPHVANAYVTVGSASARQSRAARAKLTAWQGRVARGLLVDGFGRDAAALRQRVLGAFDAETLEAVGLPAVAPYRWETRSQLQQLVDRGLEQVWEGLVANLEKSTLKRFNAAMLKTVNTSMSAEAARDGNAAAMRKEALLFETVLEDLEVPALGLTKEKASRELSAKLNDAFENFPDSPAAKLKRTQKVKKAVNKEKEPGQRAIGFGLDLVAMLRPDGFGSLQGFAGYQLPGGNSITFGVHNDADDPQVISQFGGVRPPLLRVQPKLRIDAEL